MDQAEHVDRSALRRSAFREAAACFVEATELVPPDAWERPGLGVWSVRSLVGHTSRALLTVESYLDAGAVLVTIGSAVDYYAGALQQPGDGTAVAERGRQAGLALGEDPAGAVRAIAARAVDRLERAADTDLAGTPWGGMSILEYLPTRIFELTIHTLDLRAALKLPAPDQAPEAALVVTFDLLGKLACRRHLETDLLLAATGRRALPEGYTVL